MNILTSDLEKRIQNRIIKPLLKEDYDSAIQTIPVVIDELYANIPDNKRISYRIVHTVKTLTDCIYTQLQQNEKLRKL